MPSAHESHSGLSTATSNRQPMLGSHVSVVHGSSSLHTLATPPAQLPATHCSPVVQKLASLHIVRFAEFGCWQTPAPLHWSFVHWLPSSAHGEPGDSKKQVAEQQSPL